MSSPNQVRWSMDALNVTKQIAFLFDRGSSAFLVRRSVNYYLIHFMELAEKAKFTDFGTGDEVVRGPLSQTKSGVKRSQVVFLCR